MVLAAPVDLTGDWSWTVWLLIPLVVVLAYVTARCVGPSGDPAADPPILAGCQPLPRHTTPGRTSDDAPTIADGAPPPAGRCSCRVALLGAACGQKSGVAGSDEEADGAVPHRRRSSRRPRRRCHRRRRRRAPGQHAGGLVPVGRRGPDDGAGAGHDRGAGRHDRPRRPSGRSSPAATTPPASPTPRSSSASTPRSPARRRSPRTSFDIGKDIYWQWLAGSAPDELFGRKVRVVFRDDQFDPQAAVQACREMVEQDGAFLLVGGGGADQITACAQYAADNGIPYLSAGVNENGLADLDTYFATTLTYAEQAPMLIDQITADGLTEIGLVVTDTPSFDDAQEAIKAAADEAGVTIAYETRLNKTAAEAEQLSVVQELKNSGVEAVVLLSSPLVFIGLANQGLNQGFTPTWLGPGVTSGLNAVTDVRLPGRGDRRVLLAHAGPRRHRPARSRLRAGLRRVRRGSPGRRHRPPAVVAEQGAGADVRGHRTGARSGGVHEHPRHDARRSTTASTPRSRSRPSSTSAAPAPTCSTPTAPSSSSRRPSSSSPRAERGRAAAEARRDCSSVSGSPSRSSSSSSPPARSSRSSSGP